MLLGTERCWPVHRARYRPGFGGEGDMASGLVLELCHPGPEKEGGICGCSYRQNLDQPKMGPGDEAPHLKVNGTLCQRPVALGRGEQDRLGDITVRHGAD